MKIDIQKIWYDGKCPIMNGIIFGDGHAILFDVSEPSERKVEYTFHVTSKTSVDNLTSELTELGPMCESINKENGLTAVAGEGSWGGEGFIALQKTLDKRLIWIALFDCSNPFIKVALDNSCVSGVTNHGDSWLVPLKEPEKLLVRVNWPRGK